MAPTPALAHGHVGHGPLGGGSRAFDPTWPRHRRRSPGRRGGRWSTSACVIASTGCWWLPSPSHALPVDTDQSAEVAGIEVALTRVRMVYEPRLAEVLAAFAAAGIDVRVLKGSALAHLDYPDPQHRPTGDIDVLVRGEQIDAAIELFVREGATRLDPDPVPGYAAVVGKGATLLPGGRRRARPAPAARLGTDRRPRCRRTSSGGRLDPFVRRRPRAAHPRARGDAAARRCHLMVGGQPRGCPRPDVAQLLAAPRARPGARHRSGPALGGRGGAGRGGPSRRSPSSVCVGDVALAGWAAGYAPRRRRPGVAADRSARRGAAGDRTAWPPGSSCPPAGRHMLVDATLHPAPGTWPGTGSHGSSGWRAGPAGRQRHQVRLSMAMNCIGAEARCPTDR